LFFRQLGNYRQIIKTPRVEMCRLINTAHEPGPINKMMQVFLNASNGMVHKCPYKIGPFKINNYTESNVDFSFVSVPDGEYKTIIQFSNDNDNNIGNVVAKASFRTNATADMK